MLIRIPCNAIWAEKSVSSERRTPLWSFFSHPDLTAGTLNNKVMGVESIGGAYISLQHVVVLLLGGQRLLQNGNMSLIVLQ